MLETYLCKHVFKYSSDMYDLKRAKKSHFENKTLFQ